MVPNLFNLLGLTTIAILFVAAPANALSVDSSVHMARHQAIARQISLPEPLAKRSTISSRCKARPISPSVQPTSTPSPSPSPSPSPPAPKFLKTPAASPAPSPSPSPAPKQSSAKAGLAWALGNDPAFQHFLGPKISTVYTWSAFAPPNLYGLEFVPMLWGPSKIDDFTRLVVSGYAKAALAFNEPDLATQANINAWYAADLWRKYLQPLKAQGYTLISPATSSAPTGKKWMQDFFGACNGCTIDFVALHWYGTDANAFIAYVTDFYKTFNREIWVTEFACMNFAGGAQASEGEIFAFMKTVTAWMDNTPWVAKYFAFGVMKDMGNVSPLNQLMNAQGYPNALGYTYIG